MSFVSPSFDDWISFGLSKPNYGQPFDSFGLFSGGGVHLIMGGDHVLRWENTRMEPMSFVKPSLEDWLSYGLYEDSYDREYHTFLTVLHEDGIRRRIFGNRGHYFIAIGEFTCEEEVKKVLTILSMHGATIIDFNPEKYDVNSR